jgi:hypothetical protein
MRFVNIRRSPDEQPEPAEAVPVVEHGWLRAKAPGARVELSRSSRRAGPSPRQT